MDPSYMRYILLIGILFSGCSEQQTPTPGAMGHPKHDGHKNFGRRHDHHNAEHVSGYQDHHGNEAEENFTGHKKDGVLETNEEEYTINSYPHDLLNGVQAEIENVIIDAKDYGSMSEKDCIERMQRELEQPIRTERGLNAHGRKFARDLKKLPKEKADEFVLNLATSGCESMKKIYNTKFA
jgi:hypothetical protein